MYLLATICVFTSVRHAQQSLLVYISPADVFIGKLAFVYRVSTSSIAFRDIPTLDHEVVYHSMEGRHLVCQRRFRACA